MGSGWGRFLPTDWHGFSQRRLRCPVSPVNSGAVFLMEEEERGSRGLRMRGRGD